MIGLENPYLLNNYLYHLNAKRIREEKENVLQRRTLHGTAWCLWLSAFYKIQAYLVTDIRLGRLHGLTIWRGLTSLNTNSFSYFSVNLETIFVSCNKRPNFTVSTLHAFQHVQARSQDFCKGWRDRRSRARRGGAKRRSAEGGEVWGEA